MMFYVLDVLCLYTFEVVQPTLNPPGGKEALIIVKGGILFCLSYLTNPVFDVCSYERSNQAITFWSVISLLNKS